MFLSIELLRLPAPEVESAGRTIPRQPPCSPTCGAKAHCTCPAWHDRTGARHSVYRALCVHLFEFTMRSSSAASSTSLHLSVRLRRGDATDTRRSCPLAGGVPRFAPENRPRRRGTAWSPRQPPPRGGRAWAFARRPAVASRNNGGEFPEIMAAPERFLKRAGEPRPTGRATGPMVPLELSCVLTGSLRSVVPSEQVVRPAPAPRMRVRDWRIGVGCQDVAGFAGRRLRLRDWRMGCG